MVSKSKKHWLIAHEDELKSLPDSKFMFKDTCISYSLFRQAIERGVIKEVRKAENGVKVWEVKDEINELIAEEIEEGDNHD